MLRQGTPAVRSMSFAPRPREAPRLVLRRRICSLKGNLVSPKTRKTLPVVATDMNFNLDSQADLERLEAATERLPKDRAIAINTRETLDPGFKHFVVGETCRGMVRVLGKKSLKYRRGRGSVVDFNPTLIASLKTTDGAKDLMLAALCGLPLPPVIDVMDCLEVMQHMQLAMALEQDLFKSDQEAFRFYPEPNPRTLEPERSHPRDPRGIYLAKDPGTIALLDARMPVNCGTSGSSGTAMNGLFNLRGELLAPELVRPMAMLLHAHFAGRQMIDVLTREIEPAVMARIEGTDLLPHLKRVGLGQTHTMGEIFNGCLMADAAQRKGGPLTDTEKEGVIRNGVEATERQMNKV